MLKNTLSHLEKLESEAIHIIREVVAQADNPVMLYSIGKDSAVMLHLAKKLSTLATRPSHYCMLIRLGNFRKCMLCAINPLKEANDGSNSIPESRSVKKAN